MWDYSDPDNPKLLNGIEDKHTTNIEMQIVPNPTSGNTFVYFPNVTATSSVQLELYTSSGLLLSTAIYQPEQTCEVNLQQCSAGLYLLKANVDGKLIIKKIIKQ